MGKPKKAKFEDTIRTADIEQQKYIYGLINGWIENADAKVSISCAVFTGVFGVITFLAEYFVKDAFVSSGGDCRSCIRTACLVASVVTILLATVCYAKAIIPNLNSNDVIGQVNKKYPIFYGDISSIKLEDYQEKMREGKDQDIADELVLEIWYNSKICINKMVWYKRGVQCSLVAIAFATLSLLEGYIMGI